MSFSICTLLHWMTAEGRVSVWRQTGARQSSVVDTVLLTWGLSMIMGYMKLAGHQEQREVRRAGLRRGREMRDSNLVQTLPSHSTLIC